MIVIGPMGAGKTTVGRLLAGLLDIPFHDSDALLEAGTGQTGAQIAAGLGVTRLHDLELEVFLEAARGGPRSVIAPAASVIESPEARAVLILNDTVWLDASPPVLAARRRSGGHRRPLDSGESLDLEARRRDLYGAVSDIRIDTTSLRPVEVADLIVAILRDKLET